MSSMALCIDLFVLISFILVSSVSSWHCWVSVFVQLDSNLLHHILNLTIIEDSKEKKLYCNIRVLSTSYANSSLISLIYTDNTIKKKK